MRGIEPGANCFALDSITLGKKARTSRSTNNRIVSIMHEQRGNFLPISCCVHSFLYVRGIPRSQAPHRALKWPPNLHIGIGELHIYAQLTVEIRAMMERTRHRKLRSSPSWVPLGRTETTALVNSMRSLRMKVSSARRK